MDLSVALVPSDGGILKPNCLETALKCPAMAAMGVAGLAPAEGAPPTRWPFTGQAWAATKALITAAENDRRFGGTTQLGDLWRRIGGDWPNAAVKSFALHATEGFLDARDQVGSDPTEGWMAITVPHVRVDEATVTSGGALIFRHRALGTQVWRLRTGIAQSLSEQTESWALIAAYTASRATGSPHVRVFEFGASDGSVTQIGDWTQQELLAAFDRRMPQFQSLRHAREARPGPHCADCPARNCCPALPKRSGILTGVQNAHGITISAGRLRDWETCPARFDLSHRQGVPRATATGELVERGAEVHRLLREGHITGTCHVNPAEARTAEAAALTEHHLCPFDEQPGQAVVAEGHVAMLDVQHSVLLVAAPDLAYTVDGRRRWHETKTARRLPRLDPHTLVGGDITAALYLFMLGEGADGPSDVLEWEVLSDDDTELVILPTDDRELVDLARRTVTSAIADLLADGTWAPRPGTSCGTCSVQRWCPAAMGVTW